MNSQPFSENFVALLNMLLKHGHLLFIELVCSELGFIEVELDTKRSGVVEKAAEVSMIVSQLKEHCFMTSLKPTTGTAFLLNG